MRKISLALKCSTQRLVSQSNVLFSGNFLQLLQGDLHSDTVLRCPTLSCCLLPVALCGFTGKWVMGILTTCQNHLIWLPSSWRGRGSTPRSPLIAELIPSWRMRPVTLQRNLIFCCLYPQFHSFGHNPELMAVWGLGRRLTGKSRALLCGSAQRRDCPH